MYPVFHPSPHIHIPIYLVVMSLAFSVAVVYFFKRAIKLNLPAKTSSELSIAVMIGAFLGARIFHVLLEYPEYYWNEPLEIFKFYKGGFVFYGGFFGGLILSYLYVKRIKQNFFSWLDCAAPVLSLSYAIGRVGCLFAGCCFGKECTLPWAITFPPGVEAPANIPLHPTQIYSILIELVIFGILIFIEKYRSKNLKTGSLFFIWIFCHGVGRAIVEHFRGDFRGESVFGYSISLIISIALVAFSAYSLMHSKKKSQD